MTKYIVTFKGEPERPEYDQVEIEEGYDWDGRPVYNQWDAADAAFDIISANRPDFYWTTEEVETIEEN